MADANPRAARTPGGDAGFSLIEVIVALGIFVVIVTALLPLFVGGIRSVSKADREGVVNGLLQQEVERLRGLPYRVSLGTSDDGTDDDVDLLDLYYPNISHTAPATVSCPGAAGFSMTDAATWAGYVASGQRCPFEPSTGAMYRTVSVVDDSELGQVAMVRDLQFLTGGSTASPTPTPASPRPSYDSDHAVTNYPPSSQVGVTVSLLYVERGQTNVRSLFTQIDKHDAGPTLVRTNVDAKAVEITALAPDGASEDLSAGVVSFQGSVGDISSADVSLSGVVARMATGDTTTSQLGYGATTTVSAPPSAASLTPVDVTPDWGAGGCAALLCYGTSHVGSDGAVGVETGGGLPQVGSSSSPLRAAVTDTGNKALTFDNVGSAEPVKPWSGGIVRLAGALPGSSTLPPPAACPEGVGSSVRLSGAGYLATALHDDSANIRDTAACASTRSAAVGILPTTWAPDGIIQVTVNRSFAWCTITGGVGTGGVGLSATVQVFDPATDHYRDPVPAETFDPSTAKVSDAHGFVSDYLSGWSFDGGIAPPASSGSVTAEVPGIRVTTIPTRYTTDDAGNKIVDPDSAVVVVLGAASCSSESDS